MANCKCTSGSWGSWQSSGRTRMVRYYRCKHGTILNTEYKDV